MASDFPAGFVPDAQQFPPGFVPDAAPKAAPTIPGGSIHGPEEPNPKNDFQGTMGNNRAERYMTEAENMTQEGAKQHPVENFVGQTATKAKQFGGMLATEAGVLFGGPEGFPVADAPPYREPIRQPASSLTPKTSAIQPYVPQVNGEVVEPAPPARVPRAQVEPRNQLPPASSIQTPPPQMSMREQAGARPVTEPPLRVVVPKDVVPAAPPARVPKTEPIQEARPQVDTTPARPPSTRSLMNRLGSQIEDVSKYPPIQPTAKAVPARGTVGAKTVAEAPNIEVAGPRIATPSRNTALTQHLGEQMETGGTAPERNANAFYKDFSSRERQDIHRDLETRQPDGTYVPGTPNIEKHWEALKDKPELREQMKAMTNDQVRESLRKSDIVDLGNKTVKSSDWTSQGKAGKPFKNPDVIPRARAIGQMLDAGIKPEDIVKWGGEEETRGKPDLPRFTPGPSREGLVTGPADRGYPEK
jgi:hypothetical protein